MSGFDDGWLALREGADDRARDAALERTLLRALHLRKRGRSGAAGGATRVLDLGSGTGANFRRLAPVLGANQHWTLVDHDRDLLGRLEARSRLWCETHRATLSSEGDAVTVTGARFDARVERRAAELATELDQLPFEGADLVTGSALLDLAGAAWLDALAARCAGAGAAVLFVLGYDGRVRWTPSFADDGDVHARFDRHQRQDKGLGVALGPDATGHFAAQLRVHDLDVRTATSDWALDDAEIALQRELADGFANAAGEIDPDFIDRAATWIDARRRALEAAPAARPATTLIGHLDVAAWPRDTG